MADENIKTGGPAFPVQWPDGVPDSGMSLRDYFAGQALSGWLACSPDLSIYSLDNGAPDRVATAMFKFADAMIKARGS